MLRRNSSTSTADDGALVPDANAACRLEPASLRDDAADQAKRTDAEVKTLWRRAGTHAEYLPVASILPQTFFDACILRAILSVRLCGT